MSAEHSNGVFSIELSEQFLRSDDELSQGVWGEHNLAMASHGREENVAVSEFEFWGLLRKIAVLHAPISCSSEQANNNLLTFDNIVPRFGLAA